MSKFQYILGWIGVVLSVVGVIGIVVAGIVEGLSWTVVVKLAWLPFVLGWSVYQIRRYKLEKILRIITGEEVSK